MPLESGAATNETYVFSRSQSIFCDRKAWPPPSASKTHEHPEISRLLRVVCQMDEEENVGRYWYSNSPARSRLPDVFASPVSAPRVTSYPTQSRPGRPLPDVEAARMVFVPNAQRCRLCFGGRNHHTARAKLDFETAICQFQLRCRIQLWHDGSRVRTVVLSDSMVHRLSWSCRWSL